MAGTEGRSPEPGRPPSPAPRTASRMSFNEVVSGGRPGMKAGGSSPVRARSPRSSRVRRTDAVASMGTLRLLGQSVGRPRLAPVVVTGADQVGGQKGQLLLQPVTQAHFLPPPRHVFRVLVVEGDGRSHQEDQPAQVDPDHEHDQGGESRIDCRIFGRRDDQGGEGPSRDLPQDAGDDGADQGGE